VSEGIIQARVSAQAYRMQRDIESGQFPKVGVNRYRNEREEDHPVEFHSYKEEDARMQIDGPRRIRRRARPGSGGTGALTRAPGRGNRANVMPAIVEAVKPTPASVRSRMRWLRCTGATKPIRFRMPFQNDDNGFQNRRWRADGFISPRASDDPHGLPSVQVFKPAREGSFLYGYPHPYKKRG
jgi:hypothetical protein